MKRLAIGQKWLAALLAAVLLLCTLPVGAWGEAQYGRVNLNKVRFRKTATSSDSGEWWCLLNSGWVVEVLEERTENGSEWYRVRCNIPDNLDRNYTGYIMKKFVTLMTEQEQANWLKNPVQPGGKAAYTATPGPQGATPAPTATPVPAPTQTAIIVTALPTAVPTAAPDSTPTVPADAAYVKYGRTTVDKVFFRQGPGSELYWELLPKGWILKIIGETTDKNQVKWYNVQGGIPSDQKGTYSGSIHSGFFEPLGTVTQNPFVPTAVPPVTAQPGVTNPPAESGYAMVLMTGTNVRKTADDSSASLTALSYGELVQIISGGTGEKAFVRVRDMEGYVPTSALRMMTLQEYQDLFSHGATPPPEVTAAPTGIVPQVTTAAPTAVPSNVTPGPIGTVIGYIRLIKDGVNLRKTPGGQSLTPSSDEWLSRGLILPYYQEPVLYNGYSWIYVSYLSMFGYIRSDCYEISYNPNVTPEPTQVPANSGYIRLIKGGVNLRKAPDGDVVGRLARGTVLPYFGTAAYNKQTWYYVYSSDASQYGYIMGTMTEVVSGPVTTPTAVPFVTQTPANVTPTAVPPIVTPTPAVSSRGWAVTTADKVYFRSGPSTASQPLGQIAKAGEIMALWDAPVTADRVTWYPVIYNGITGYVHGGFSQMLSDWQMEEYRKSGIMPTASPSPTPVPIGNSSYIMITTDKVWVRSGAGTNYTPIGNGVQVNKGDVFFFDKTTVNGKVTWYRIYYTANTVGYVHGGFAKVMTQVEYNQWAEGHPTAAPTLVPTAVPTSVPTPAPTALMPTATPGSGTPVPDTSNVKFNGNLTLGSSGVEVLAVQQKLVEKVYLASSEISGQYLASTMNAVIAYQRANDLKVDGIVGTQTWESLFRAAPVPTSTPDNTNGTPGANNAGSSVIATLYPVEMVDWYTGDIQQIWAPGVVAIVTDVYTGISYRARRLYGDMHADVEPLTSADTKAICATYGVARAQDIADKRDSLQTWRRRPLWITIGTRTFAGSGYCVPHNYPDGDSIPDNDYNGQFCVHFINSKTHGSKIVDYDNANNAYFGHQSAIRYAYEHSISGTK